MFQSATIKIAVIIQLQAIHFGIFAQDSAAILHITILRTFMGFNCARIQVTLLEISLLQHQ